MKFLKKEMNEYLNGGENIKIVFKNRVRTVLIKQNLLMCQHKFVINIINFT